MQLFIAREETKFGLSYEECESLLQSEVFKGLKHVVVRGFMAMASNTSDEKQIEQEFKGLKAFSDRMMAQASHNFEPGILSFGMSSDFKIALACGSNMLRIGSTIFGERQHPA